MSSVNKSNPNLVFIFSDRQRFDTLRVYGNDWIRTPNINALADESVVFRNCYVTQPVCAPARSSIMTAIRGRLSALTETALRFHVGTCCCCLALIGLIVEIGKIFVLFRRTSDFGRDLNVEIFNGL